MISVMMTVCSVGRDKQERSYDSDIGSKQRRMRGSDCRIEKSLYSKRSVVKFRIPSHVAPRKIGDCRYSGVEQQITSDHTERLRMRI